MRLAMVGPFGFHPNKTMRARALGLARALATRGHQVKMVMPPWQTPQEAGRSWLEAGVSVQYVTLTGGVPAITARLVRACLAWQPDVVHSFKPKAYSGLVAWWLWHFHRGQFRLVTDSDDWEGAGGWNERGAYTWLQRRLFAWQERWGLVHCHRLTVASRTLQSLAWAQGVAPDRVVYLPNGPGVAAGNGGGQERRAALGLEGRPVLLLYSRLFEFDNARLVRILQQVQAELPALAVLAVGTSLFAADAALFRQRLEAANLASAVVDVGWAEEEELPALLSAADVGIYLMEDNLLNRSKCPVKLADMAACGVPVVAETVGQVAEYVRHGQTGLLRPAGDDAGLAADLVSLLRDRQQCRQFGLAAQAHIGEHFSWDRLAQVAEKAYA